MQKPIVAIFLALSVSSVLADAPPPPAPITIHRAEGAIKIDGDLSDPGWKNAATIDKFYETSPGDNIPAKVKTVAYLTYDDHAFYIGVRCDDPDPKKIRAPYVDRDQVIGTDDNIAVFIDTRNDKRTSIELRVNPRGIQADGIFNDANGGTEDFSPDYFYDTAAKIDSGGWSAEYRIPFSSLRYEHRDPQTWNILIWRNYPRDFRYAFHSGPLPRGSNCLVCHTHPIVGLTGLPEAGHMVIAPYATAQQNEVP
ncbi:MAG TPA: carbohydrate binding family 9 domain-containing protein, partial [Thermoanaerobaculia bacterium]|nr:carbohydrate binding family 9 domain-containing protein [Thermoanaerobaculia bacterium]